jgi:uncharacterized protein (UPF0210 family)
MNENGESRIAKAIRDGTVDRAMKKAVRQAMEMHRKLGIPIVEWIDGKIVVTPGEEIVLPPEEE